MMLRQEKVGSGKLEFIHHSLGRVLHGPGADAGSGPEIPPREGGTLKTVVLDHLLVRQACDCMVSVPHSHPGPSATALLYNRRN